MALIKDSVFQMVVSVSFLFFYGCAKRSQFSISAIRLVMTYIVLLEFNIFLPLWITFNTLRSREMNKVS